MIGVIDVGLGNIGSLLNMLERIGAPARAITTHAEIEGSRSLILPGVGAFDHGMARLHASGLIETITQRVGREGVPLLGVCLGMQLLGRSSEEGRAQGLGLIPAVTRRFNFSPAQSNLRLPHMGWNQCRPANGSRLIDSGADVPRFYFVHSYHVVCDALEFVAGWTHYGHEFAAAVQHDNIYGVQFHPEKSHRHGKQLLARFVALTS